jgi:alkaline phosphatase D
LVLTGDVHSHGASDVRERPDDPSSRLVATELVTTPIGSRGDASDSRDEIDAVLVSRLASRCACAHRRFVRDGGSRALAAPGMSSDAGHCAQR